MTTNQVSLTQLGNKIKNFKVESNSVLVMRNFDGFIWSDREIEYMEKIFTKAGKENVLILVVDNLEDVQKIPESKMNEYGWFRIDHLRRLVLRKGETHDDGG